MWSHLDENSFNDMCASSLSLHLKRMDLHSNLMMLCVKV